MEDELDPFDCGVGIIYKDFDLNEKQFDEVSNFFLASIKTC